MSVTEVDTSVCSSRITLYHFVRCCSEISALGEGLEELQGSAGA